MTILATISITVTIVGLLCALFAYALSRGPGWRELRYLAGLSLCAGLYTVSNVPVTLVDVPAQVDTWFSRVGLVFAGFHGCFWYAYRAAQERRKLVRWERAVMVLQATAALASVVPNLVMSDWVSVREIAWLGVIVRDPVPTNFGSACLGFHIIALLPLLGRYIQDARRKKPGALVHAIGLGTLAATAAHDGAVASFELNRPYLLDFGFVALLVSVGTSVANRFVKDARELEASSMRLKRAQDELVKRERLAALGELSAVVAHEVRNPLGVIFNALATMKRVPPTSADHAELLRIVQEEAERLKRVVADLLEFARPRELHLSQTSLSLVLAGAAEAARSAVGEPESTVLVDVPEDLPPLLCDEQLVRQAVINLVTNAILAPERKSPVKMRAESHDDDVLVEVRDDGAGVPADVAPHIFTPFFTTRATGTGLGLSVVQRIAEAHGGEVTYAPVPPPDHGAIFSLRIPRKARRGPVSLLDSAERQL